MRPAPHDSSGKPSSSAPAAGPAPTTPSAPSAPASTAPTPINELGASSPDLLQVPRTVAYSSYPLPEVENIAGFVMPGLPHGQIFGPYPMLHSDPPRRFSESARARGQAATPESDHRTPNPLPRPPRTSEEDHKNAYEWSYDAIWDQN